MNNPKVNGSPPRPVPAVGQLNIPALATKPGPGAHNPSSAGQSTPQPLDRKAIAEQLLRDLAATLAGHADMLARSQMGSPEWIVAQLITVQAVGAYWQSKIGEYAAAWGYEDGSGVRSPSLDW